MSLDLIDNMLIVTPPKEENDREDTGNSGDDSSSRNILDVDYLNIGDLLGDELASQDLEFTELDINYLDVNFLEDLLDIVEELDQLETETEQSAFSTTIKGPLVCNNMFAFGACAFYLLRFFPTSLCF